MKANFKWRGKSYGGKFGNGFFIFLIKNFGLYPAYAFLVFVAAYYVLFRRRAYRQSADYLRRISGGKIRFMPFAVFAHFYNFGVTLIDKSAYLAGCGKFTCINNCSSQIKDALGKGAGAIVLIAHIGSREIAANSLKSFGRKVSLVGVHTEDENIKRVLENYSKLEGINFVSEDSFGGLVSCYASLKKGEIVAMQFDRFAGGEFVLVDFLGSRIKLPSVAFNLASAAGSPLIYAVCVRRKFFEYEICPLGTVSCQNVDKADLPEFARINLQKLMNSVEKILQRHKFQWFNFYDYWNNLNE